MSEIMLVMILCVWFKNNKIINNIDINIKERNYNDDFLY
jgi:hypothetical protein